ncbi:hypothetical protein GT755_19590 [Herbidospora sp. NEAU-GS84]|uniref:Uncharacterized protein n=1 Tax=Herbidospora solisilvae TaxID=2696284 RepID=A0A7C9J9T2_9ACTN|nr:MULTISPECIES: hypothetical protein [Herbidospora]NAS23888.1 hypothetical protein [Herbidospora solisilvae]
MAVFELICYLIAFVLFVLAALNVGARFNLMAAGLAAAVLPTLVEAFNALN